MSIAKPITPRVAPHYKMGFAMLNPSYDIADPLTADELAAGLEAIGGFESRPLLAVAVSGGPDSLALTLLADHWARQRGGVACGVTVDHGLRPESVAEAATVAGWLDARGIPHAILAWRGPKPASGIEEAARDARYRLLAEWCRAKGVLHLLTAHHREDQAETYLIRRRAGSGPDGLAAMSAVRELPGCRLVRPLLGVPRARLAALLAAEGQLFLDDPSNANPAFERARLRLQSQSASIFTIDSVDIRSLGEQRIAREDALDALLGRAVALHPAGFGVIDAAAVGAADSEFVERLLARVARCIGGARYPARRDRVARLREGLAAAPGRARTLGGCRFVPWRGRILVMRELAAADPPRAVEPGETVLWDRRFAVTLPAETPGALVLGYLGPRGERLSERYSGDVPRFVHPVLPALWDGRGLAAVPSVGYRRSGVEVSPCVLFRPAHPLSQAGFTVV